MPSKSKALAIKSNANKIVLKNKVGLFVTDELQRAIQECKEKVENISKACRAQNRKFRDNEFDVENETILCLCGLEQEDAPALPNGFKRVTEIFDDPHFFVDGASSGDIMQGHVDDSWFLSALSTVSSAPGLIEKICVARDEQVGIYGFIFFRDGDWVSVIIDDILCWSLPKFEELNSQEQRLYQNNRQIYNQLAFKGGHGLEFARSGTPGETWVPLIEKAYAKLHGDYQSLSVGRMSEAVEDMTGGVCFSIYTSDILDKDRFWKEELLHANDHTRVFGVSFGELDQSRGSSAETISGLFGSHAYCVLRVKECKGKRFLVLRNPWGKSEWSGPWSDGSSEWQGEWLDVLKELDHVFGDDGEFVMEYTDFLQIWTMIESTTIFDESWVMTTNYTQVPSRPVTSAWTWGELSFQFDLPAATDAILVLSRLDDRFFKNIAGNIGYGLELAVYKLGDKKCLAFAQISEFMERSVSCHVYLEPGTYIVFPRIERRKIREPIDEEEKEDWIQSKLGRVLTKRTIARSRAVNYELTSSNLKYLPIELETLIKDELLADEEGYEDDEEDDEKEKEEDPKGGKGEIKTEDLIADNEQKDEGAEGDKNDVVDKKDDGDDDDDEDKEDDNDLFLGLRVYTKKHAVIKEITARIMITL